MSTPTLESPFSQWQKADFALQHGVNRILLYGSPGTGKTYYSMNYHTNDKPAFRLICTQDMTEAKVTGTFLPTTNEQGHLVTEFHEGPAVKAWRTGGRLVIDEINRASADVESLIMAFIDTSTSSSWQHPVTGEIVKPHKDFSVIATMNGMPEDLPSAVQDRLVVQLDIQEPHPDAINALPEYLRDIAFSMVSRVGDDRYSLRNFVEFHTAYTSSGDLEKSALICLPRIAEALVDAVAIKDQERS